MTRPNQSMRQAMYRLKRTFGKSISLQDHTVVTDVKTGSKTTSIFKLDIRRALVMDAREFRMFIYDQSYLAANGKFTAGGFFDPSDKHVVIDDRDLGGRWTLNADQFIMYDGKMYNITEVHAYLDSWLVMMRKVRGEIITQLVDAVNVLVIVQNLNVYLNGKLVRFAPTPKVLVPVEPMSEGDDSGSFDFFA